ncbi:MAG: protein-L-isoaspartate O-methyltransferase [Thiotrichaceae bacterium]
MAQLDFARARFNMVEQQVRPWDVLEQRVLDLLFEIPREEFVPPAYHTLAFADISIPLAHGQVMMSPKLEGRLLQTLQIKPSDKVLEIGTGSGYFTALLAKLAKRVETVDIYEDFVKDAERAIKAQHISNVCMNTGDAISGWKTDVQYDVIVATGSVPVLKPHFQEQLKLNGRLLAIVGTDPVMEARLITRMGDNEWQTDSLFETSLPALIGAPVSNRFIF